MRHPNTLRSLTTLTALSAGALLLSAAPPATAASTTVTDPDDTTHGSDLLSVRVRNAEHKVVVVTHHANLRKDPASGSGGALYVDTDPDDKGPEYVLVGGYFEGTDYVLLHTEGFPRKSWGQPAEGSYRMTVDYAADTVRFRMSRAVLGTPDEVRVGAKVSGTRPNGSTAGTVDWLGQPRSFTPWVARG